MKAIVALTSSFVMVSIVILIAYVLIGHKSAYEPIQPKPREVPRGFL